MSVSSGANGKALKGKGVSSDCESGLDEQLVSDPGAELLAGVTEGPVSESDSVATCSKDKRAYSGLITYCQGQWLCRVGVCAQGSIPTRRDNTM